MNQLLFNTIQENFKKFLFEKSRPVIRETIIKEEMNVPKAVKLEETYGFGKDDCEIARKIYFIDKNGKETYKILPP